MNGAPARGGGRLRGGARDVGACTAPIQARLAHKRAARTCSCTSPLARLAPCTPAVSARTRHGDDQAREQGRLDAVEGGLLDRMRLHCLFAPVDVDQLGSAVDQICLIHCTVLCGKSLAKSQQFAPACRKSPSSSWPWHHIYTSTCTTWISLEDSRKGCNLASLCCKGVNLGAFQIPASKIL